MKSTNKKCSPFAPCNVAGYFMYIESSLPSEKETKSVLVSTFFVRYFNCLTFYYHMWGEDMGTLNVYMVDSDEKVQLVWRAVGNQGNQWKKAQAKINSVITFQVG